MRMKCLQFPGGYESNCNIKFNHVLISKPLIYSDYICKSKNKKAQINSCIFKFYKAINLNEFDPYIYIRSIGMQAQDIIMITKGLTMYMLV